MIRAARLPNAAHLRMKFGAVARRRRRTHSRLEWQAQAVEEVIEGAARKLMHRYERRKRMKAILHPLVVDASALWIRDATDWLSRPLRLLDVRQEAIREQQT